MIFFNTVIINQQNKCILFEKYFSEQVFCWVHEIPKEHISIYVNSWKQLQCVWKVHCLIKFKYSIWNNSYFVQQILSLTNMILKFRLASILIIPDRIHSVELSVKFLKNGYFFQL